MIRDYEFDLHSEDPFWEPSSKEEELRMELQRIGIVEYRPESLKYELQLSIQVVIYVKWYILVQQNMWRAGQWSVWSGEQRSVECGGWGEGGRSKITDGWLYRRQRDPVLAGGSHYGAVQTSKCADYTGNQLSTSTLCYLINLNLNICVKFFSYTESYSCGNDAQWWSTPSPTFQSVSICASVSFHCNYVLRVLMLLLILLLLFFIICVVLEP